MDNLLVDLYALDLNGKPNMAALLSAGPPWAGVCLKANQGTYYPHGPRRDWFLKYWKEARGAELNPLWMRGAYDYADLHYNPEDEVDFFLKLVDEAGGWSPFDMLPMVDIESAGNPDKIGKAKLEDWVSRYSAAMVAKHGRKPLLYGNIYLAENGFRGLHGTAGLIAARYSRTLPADIYTRLGLTIKDLAGWQYTGTGDPTWGPSGYPAISPLDKKQKVDITALQWPLEKLRAG